MNRLLKVLSTLSVIALSATSASAAMTIIGPCPTGVVACTSLQPHGTTFNVTGGNPVSGTDSLTADIGHVGIPTGGFTDLFKFKIGTAGQGLIGGGSGTVITYFLGTSFSINNLTASFFNGTDTFTPIIGNFNGFYSAIFNVPIFGGAENTITITGNVPETNGGMGSFGGTIGFAPGSVPEPSTWAMMLLGFGAMGASIRRRRGKLIMQIA